MIVVIDSTILLPLLRPGSSVASDPTTKKPVTHVPERLALLVKRLEKEKAQLVVPTPALSEVLVHAGDEIGAILTLLKTRSVFRIASFDTRAAVEVAAMTKVAIGAGDKRGGRTGDWHWIKYDRQIVAIAVVEQATQILSDDPHVKAFGAERNLPVIGLYELPLPEADPQGALPLGLSTPKNDETEDDDSASDKG